MLIFLLGLSVALALWARSLRRHRGLMWMRAVPWLLGLGWLDALVGWIYGMNHAIGGLGQINAAERQTRMVEGIAWASLSVAIQIGLISLCLIVVFVAWGLTNRPKR